MPENFKKIIDALSNPDFISQAETCKTEEDVINLLAENGVEATAAEIKEVLLYVLKTTPATGAELDEGQLEQVAGGGAWENFKDFLRGFFLGGFV